MGVSLTVLTGAALAASVTVRVQSVTPSTVDEVQMLKDFAKDVFDLTNGEGEGEGFLDPLFLKPKPITLRAPAFLRPALQLSGFFSNVVRPAEQLPVGTDTLKPQMQSKVFGKPHAAMYFGSSACNKLSHLGHVRFCKECHQRSVVTFNVDCVCCVPGQRTARLETRGHF